MQAFLDMVPIKAYERPSPLWQKGPAAFYENSTKILMKELRCKWKESDLKNLGAELHQYGQTHEF